MKLSRQDQRNYGILAVFLLGVGYYFYAQLSTPDPPPAPAPVVVAAPPTAKITTRKVATPSGNVAGVATKAPGVAAETQLDPTLHMEAMLVTEALVYTGNGRNIFSANSAPAVVIPKTIASVRTTPQLIAPVRTGPIGPPPPPPIDLKFFGTETGAAGARRAFLLHGEDVFLVSSGDIVQRKYRVISIDARSILVEDIANSNRQTLPLQSN
jgi:hypothetical protein